ncbi:hypothetical protein EW146_g3449 [Bondarzewia mesenterica]|uniref:J domain-containing protein n=1 Tax=Bondarzewia mesenterica TaxID=1095465 RepID=A0A4S4LY04_9AGAM|nr:hypothetical protein EW146_g3449 [Bondarzewia mesenterica]
MYAFLFPNVYDPPSTTDPSLLPDYQLVRIYHPDSAVARLLPPPISQARFHAISKAYDVLRGRASAMDAGEGGGMPRARDFHDLSSAIWKAKQRRRAEAQLNVPLDERWKDRVFFGALLVTFGIFVMQTNMARRRSLGESLHQQDFDAAVQLKSKDAGYRDKDRGVEERSRRDADLLALDADAPPHRPSS